MSIPLEHPILEFLNSKNTYFRQNQEGLPSSKTLEPSFLRSLHLGAYSYHHHPHSSEFRNDYLQAALHHALTKKATLELVRLWNDNGLEPLLLKGFALAEFEYQHAAERFYGDVDVWLTPKDCAEAARLALEGNWSQVWSPETWLDGFKHEEAILRSPDWQVMLELHGSLAKARRWTSKLERFTHKLVQNSVLREWEGGRVRTLEPTDALIFMLLDRAQGDRWGRKLFDILDAQVLLENHNLSRVQVEARARELGCLDTLRVVWQSFDPWGGRYSLEQPNRRERWQRSFAARRDFGFMELERLLIGGPRRLKWSLQALPDVLWAWRQLRRTPDMHQLLAGMHLPARMRPDRSPKKVQEILQGAKWSLYLLGWKRDACVPRSLAVYAALRREGYAPQFVSGVRREGDVIKGHAWVELDGRPIPGSDDESAPLEFAENFRYPATLEGKNASESLEKSG